MEVLAVTYHINESRTKSITVGHDVEVGFEPYIWIYKVGAPRIMLSFQDWEKLIALDQEAAAHFGNAEYVFHVIPLDGMVSVSFVESHGNRLLCLEHYAWPVVPTNKPKAAVKMWICAKQWSKLMSLKPCIDLAYNQCKESASELHTLFESLGYSINAAYGETLRRNYGDLKMLQDYLSSYDDQHLVYNSSTGLNVPRALQEIKVLCIEQLRDFVKYFNWGN